MARLAALTLPAAAALDNSFVLPAMGWSSWYAAPYGSQVTEGFVKASAQALISSGLAAKGYTFVNVDEGWLKGRSAQNGSIYEDLAKFPSGMAALGSWITAQPTTPNGTERMRYGLYSCRGTCQCGTSKYGAVGSHGHEAADTAWMIAAGATWLKIDSCCGSQDHATAFADYAKFRDAMNSSGTPVWFNLCGWRDWYAPPDLALNYSGGQSLGNSYRIYGDGGSWRAISGAINTMAHVGQYAAPGGYPDPDNILGPHGTVGRVSEHQARTQMVLWSLAPTQLILGEDAPPRRQTAGPTAGPVRAPPDAGPAQHPEGCAGGLAAHARAPAAPLRRRRPRRREHGRLRSTRMSAAARGAHATPRGPSTRVPSAHCAAAPTAHVWTSWDAAALELVPRPSGHAHVGRVRGDRR